MNDGEIARPRTIQSIDRAAQILEELGSGPRQLGVSELSDRLSLARPTVHGLLQTLQVNGFVEQDNSTGRYQLGAGLLGLAYKYLGLQDLRVRSIRAAEALSVEVDMAVRVGVIRRGEVAVIHHVFRPGASFRVPEVGVHIPAHVSALGKAVLAFSGDEAVAAAAARHGYQKQTRMSLDRKAFLAALEEVRTTGWALERDEAVLGESSVAAPVVDRDGVPVGALAVVADSTELRSKPSVRKVAASVVEAAWSVSREFGASAPHAG